MAASIRAMSGPSLAANLAPDTAAHSSAAMPSQPARSESSERSVSLRIRLWPSVNTMRGSRRLSPAASSRRRMRASSAMTRLQSVSLNGQHPVGMAMRHAVEFGEPSWMGLEDPAGCSLYLYGFHFERRTRSGQPGDDLLRCSVMAHVPDPGIGDAYSGRGCDRWMIKSPARRLRRDPVRRRRTGSRDRSARRGVRAHAAAWRGCARRSRRWDGRAKSPSR